MMHIKKTFLLTALLSCFSIFSMQREGGGQKRPAGPQPEVAKKIALVVPPYEMLTLSIQAGDVARAQTAIAAGAEVNKSASNGSFPLHSAAYYGNLDMVKLLIDKGALVNFTAWAGPNIGQTALYSAAGQGHLDVVRYLLDHGAAVDQPLSSGPHAGATPLHNAVDQGHIDVVRLLLARNANPNAFTAQHATPLHFAAPKGYSEIVQLLLDNGAYPNLRTNNNLTALYSAGINGQINVVQILLLNGATNRFAPTGQPGLLEFLLNTPNIPNRNGMIASLALYTGYAGREEQIKEILKNTIDPIEYAAAFENRYQLEQVLTEAKRQYKNIPELLANALLWAISNGKKENIEFLLKNNAPVYYSLEYVTALLLHSVYFFVDAENPHYKRLREIFNLLASKLPDSEPTREFLGKLLARVMKAHNQTLVNLFISKPCDLMPALQMIDRMLLIPITPPTRTEFVQMKTFLERRLPLAQQIIRRQGPTREALFKGIEGEGVPRELQERILKQARQDIQARNQLVNSYLNSVSLGNFNGIANALSAGIDVNEQTDSQGRNALWLAAQSGNVNLVTFLLTVTRARANPINRQTMQTLFDYLATRPDRAEILKTLQEFFTKEH